MPCFKPDRYYRTNDPELTVLATPGTMRQWRHQGKGPPYVKSGSRVLYKGSDLDEWLAAREVRPTNP